MLLKGFLAQIVGGLNIGRDATHLGMMLFDSRPNVISTFSNEALFTKDAVYHFVEKIPTKRFSPTRTDKALLAANNQLFTPEGGDREKFPNVLIVLTDGKTHPTSKPFAEITPLLKVSRQQTFCSVVHHSILLIGCFNVCLLENVLFRDYVQKSMGFLQARGFLSASIGHLWEFGVSYFTSFKRPIVLAGFSFHDVNESLAQTTLKQTNKTTKIK